MTSSRRTIAMHFIDPELMKSTAIAGQHDHEKVRETGRKGSEESK